MFACESKWVHAWTQGWIHTLFCVILGCSVGHSMYLTGVGSDPTEHTLIFFSCMTTEGPIYHYWCMVCYWEPSAATSAFNDCRCSPNIWIKKLCEWYMLQYVKLYGHKQKPHKEGLFLCAQQATYEVISLTYCQLTCCLSFLWQRAE